MKKLIYLMVFALVFTSCEDILEDVKPTSELTFNGFWDTEDGVRAAHSGLYSNFRNYHLTLWRLGEVRSDVWGGLTIESASDLNLIRQDISATNVPFDRWGGFYTLIHRINDFIVNVPNVSFTNEDEKANLIGQAYGLRAYVYFTMLKTWGDVPLSEAPLSASDLSDLSKARAPKAEVMAFVKADIQRSLDAFGGDNSFFNGSNVYWNKAATLSLKGEAFIWSANLLGGGSGDLNEAKSALGQVASSGVSLVADYNSLWTNESNSEYIFAMDFAIDQKTNFYSSMTGRSTEIHQLFNEDGVIMGPSGVNFVTNGGNRWGPSQKTLDHTDDVLDSRRNATFIRLFDAAGTYNASIMNKFLGTIQAGARIAVSNIPVYRYADVVLLLAEAKNLLGEDPTTEINMIRQRAYGANYDAALHGFTNGSKDANTQEILDERYKEFIGEGKRWWDLRRAGGNYIFNEVETLLSSEAYKLELPISVGMIGRNPLLEQTPGY